MTEPTQRELDNANARAAIAARQNAAYDEAKALANKALGDAWLPWMRVDLVPTEHRKTGNTTPVASVYKMCRGGKRSSQAIYIREMPDGSIAKANNYEALVGDLLDERHPTMTVEIKGTQVPIGRYETAWSVVERYEPSSAEQLAKNRERREEKKFQKEVQAMPLFSDDLQNERAIQQSKMTR